MTHVHGIVFVGLELTQYTYQMLKAGADRRILRFLSDDNLNQDCNVQNGVHRMKIMEAAKSMYLCITVTLYLLHLNLSYQRKRIHFYISFAKMSICAVITTL